MSEVPPQGGYLAKQCPVRAQWDVIRPCEPLPVPPVLERRFAAGRRFEAELVAGLVPLHPGACVVAGANHLLPITHHGMLGEFLLKELDG